MNEDDRLLRFRDLICERFELDPASLRPDARLYEDLDLDSIDAVDLALVIRQVTGRKIDPRAFHQARTIGDVEREVMHLLGAPDCTPASSPDGCKESSRDEQRGPT